MSAAAALANRFWALSTPRLLAFDVDGTLSPIVSDPAAARVPEEAQALLRVLGACKALHVALVTGRDLEGLKRMVDLPCAHRAVEHGALIVAPGSTDGVPALTAEEQAKLQAFSEWVQRELVPQGAQLESKRQSRGVHVRALAERDAELAAEVLERAQAEAQRLSLHARLGRSVLEAELAPGDKGEALRRLCEALGANGVLYAGDDLTDLPAIEHAAASGGLGLFVTSPERSDPPAFASAELDGPSGVLELLRALVDSRPT